MNKNLTSAQNVAGKFSCTLKKKREKKSKKKKNLPRPNPLLSQCRMTAQVLFTDKANRDYPVMSLSKYGHVQFCAIVLGSCDEML